MRRIPTKPDRFTLSAEDVGTYPDENTIAVGARRLIRPAPRPQTARDTSGVPAPHVNATPRRSGDVRRTGSTVWNSTRMAEGVQSSRP